MDQAVGRPDRAYEAGVFVGTLSGSSTGLNWLQDAAHYPFHLIPLNKDNLTPSQAISNYIPINNCNSTKGM